MDSDYYLKDLPGFKVFKAQDPYNPDVLTYEYNTCVFQCNRGCMIWKKKKFMVD